VSRHRVAGTDRESGRF